MSEVGTKKSAGLSRRDFLKLMGAAGTGLAFAPFVPFGNFMPNPNQASLEKVPVILPDGTQANVNTLKYEPGAETEQNLLDPVFSQPTQRVSPLYD
ncbi:MAG: twin-arginine translocation signal domain-containing protein, partial [Candidatus Nitrosomaritimum yanchengensis]